MSFSYFNVCTNTIIIVGQTNKVKKNIKGGGSRGWGYRDEEKYYNHTNHNILSIAKTFYRCLLVHLGDL